MRLHTETIGSGPDVVILHGLFGSGDNWRNQAKKLAGNFTVHCMDARNHGESPHMATMNYPAMAADVFTTCESLNIKQTHLIGHSMGGKAAMQMAILHPELIDKLIVVDIGPRQYPRHHDEILDGLSKLYDNPPPNRIQADTVLADYVEDKLVRAFLLKSLQRNSQGEYQLKFNVPAILHSYDQIAAAIEPPETFSGYEAAALFIKGAESNYLLPEDRDSVLSIFPHAKVKTISGAGHWPHSEKPEVVYKIIADFLVQSPGD